jgi:hypothetical protein
MLAEAARDALTKKIYSNLFDWLIVRINRTLGAKSKESNKQVSVLDIFGQRLGPSANDRCETTCRFAFTQQLVLI